MVVFNKLDLLLEDEAQEVTDRVIEGLAWEGKFEVFLPFKRTGTEELVSGRNDFIEALPPEV